MPGCFVVGEIVCGNKPLADAVIVVTLTDTAKKPDPRYTAKVKSNADGDWAVYIEFADQEGGNFNDGWARCDITCPGPPAGNGKTTRVQVKLVSGPSVSKPVKDMVELILARIGKKLLKEVLRLGDDKEISPALSSTNFVQYLAWGTSPKPGGKFDCCK
jgi:hypothetical protein